MTSRAPAPAGTGAAAPYPESMAERAPGAMRAAHAVGAFFDVDADWVRPDPGAAGMRRDAWLALSLIHILADTGFYRQTPIPQ